MKLSDYIIDIGRVVAYYPNLKKITRSTTATILLCQFLYWIDKTKDPDGWIYKDSSEIEEETGLTYYEQKKAKESLVELKLLDVEFRRLEHTSRYRVNQEELNSQWENLNKPSEIEKQFSSPSVSQEERSRRTDAPKKGDLVDLAIATMQSPGMQKEKIKDDIKTAMLKKFHINADGRRWEEFIEFVYVRQERYNEPFDVFVKWALDSGGFDPVYWTPEKMRTLYPQAYMESEQNKLREDFVVELPLEEEEEYAPMPKDLGIQRD